MTGYSYKDVYIFIASKDKDQSVLLLVTFLIKGSKVQEIGNSTDTYLPSANTDNIFDIFNPSDTFNGNLINVKKYFNYKCDLPFSKY